MLNSTELPELVKLLNLGHLRGGRLGALTFGAEVPQPLVEGHRVNPGSRRLAFPTAPTWQVCGPSPICMRKRSKIRTVSTVKPFARCNRQVHCSCTRARWRPGR